MRLVMVIILTSLTLFLAVPGNDGTSTAKSVDENLIFPEQPLEELEQSKKAITIDVISGNAMSTTAIRNGPKTNRLAKLVRKSKGQALSAKAIWVLEDQVEEAIKEGSGLHRMLRDGVEQGRMVVFFGEVDMNRVAQAFDITIREETLQPDPSQLVAASWISRGSDGMMNVGEVMVPIGQESSFVTDSILETTYIHSYNRLKTKRKGTSRISYTSGEPSSNWKKRGDYFVTNYNKPYGVVNQRFEFWQLVPDGDATYDWFVFDWYTQITPGSRLAASNPDYKPYVINRFYDRTYTSYHPNQILYRYGPIGTFSTSNSSVSVNVGMSAAVANAGFSYTWNIKELEISDWSDFSLQKANHKWDFNELSSVAQNAALVDPGVNTRVAQKQNGVASHYWSIYWSFRGSDVPGVRVSKRFFADNYNS